MFLIITICEKVSCKFIINLGTIRAYKIIVLDVAIIMKISRAFNITLHSSIAIVRKCTISS